MTADKRRKRRVRARAAKTGESYTAALRHLRSSEQTTTGRSEERAVNKPTNQQAEQHFNIEYGAACDIGLVRQTNEDRWLADGRLFAVADGMGGLGRGDVAAQLALDTLTNAFNQDPTVTGLVAAVHEANTVVWERSEAERPAGEPHEDQPAAMGTTIAAAGRIDDRLVVVNVGDSRVYLLRGAELTAVNADHSRFADLVRAGEISAADAVEHPERHILTVAVGTERSVVPGVDHIRPVPGDRVLLCTDGLFNEVPDETLAAILGATGTAEQTATTLVAEANRRGGSDNITAMVIDVI